jgi:hypothetical protein
MSPEENKMSDPFEEDITYEFNEKTGELKLAVPFVPEELVVVLSGPARYGVPGRLSRKRASSAMVPKPPSRLSLGVPIKPPKKIEVRVEEGS